MRIVVRYLIGEGEKVELPFVPYEDFVRLDTYVVGTPAVHSFDKLGKIRLWPKPNIEPTWDFSMEEDK